MLKTVHLIVMILSLVYCRVKMYSMDILEVALNRVVRVMGISGFFPNSSFTASFFSPLSTPLSQSLHSIDSSGPEALYWGSESVSSLTCYDSYSLEYCFSTIPSKNSRMIDPFQTGF